MLALELDPTTDRSGIVIHKLALDKPVTA